MINLREIQEKINIGGSVLLDESMSGHTTFRVGGPADLYVVPRDARELAAVRAFAGEEGLPLFVLGGGANILVSDRGIRGVVVDMSAFSSWKIEPLSGEGTGNSGKSPAAAAGEKALFTAGAGLAVSDAASCAANAGYRGLENFYAMPGSVGGAVLMNARCYDRSVSDVLVFTDILDEEGHERRILFDESAFGYKKSPFQNRSIVITGAGLRIEAADREELIASLDDYRSDRERKGHFLAPSAGSVFKNNRAFGKPTGAIIESLGLKGYAIGGARISPLHGNIIVNSGSATARDIRRLIETVERAAREKLGLELEREVIYAGEWEPYE